MSVRILIGDALTELRKLPDESVHCCVTSPPYYGLRDYGTAQWEGGDAGCDHKQGRPGSGRADGVVDDRMQRNRDGVGSMGGDCGKCGARRIDQQIGLEPSPDEYVAALVLVFREVRRVLRKDATLWLNIGDSYASTSKGSGGDGSSSGLRRDGRSEDSRIGSAKLTLSHQLFQPRKIEHGIKPKDLIGIPWLLAFALRSDGWYLRQDIIWSKPNPMPESVTDRCTKAHEYLFLLSKSERYFYDAAAIAEPAVKAGQMIHSYGTGAKDREDVSEVNDRRTRIGLANWNQPVPDTRNRRSVWEVTTQPFPSAHFATFPPALIEPCIKAGCPPLETVLDPFGGAGTTGLVADRLGRNAILIELNPAYAEMARQRIHNDAPLFTEVA